MPNYRDAWKSMRLLISGGVSSSPILDIEPTLKKKKSRIIVL